MAINAYCGVMGSGKSFEVVSGPLLDAVVAGRRVVTNIDGVNEELIHDYLHEKRGIPGDRLGEIVHVRTDDLLQDKFFPVEVEGAGGATVTPGFVKPGDLVVVDEAWKLWSTDKKISKEHMNFFRMHRHFVHEETGVACDVILMIQSIGDLHRSVKAVVELSFRMTKLKSVGMSGSYRVEMYETAKQTAGTKTGTFVKRYKPEIFPLYKSYAGSGGNESVVDKRQNIFARKSLWFIAFGVIAMMICGGWGMWHFFHPAIKASRIQVKGAGKIAVSNEPVAPEIHGPRTSDEWRIVGSYRSEGMSFVVLVDAANHLRVESPSEFMGRGVSMVGTVEGQRVAMWSGPKPSTSAVAVPGAPK